CRNNPFGRSWTRVLDRGLAVMDAPKGSLIAYATSPKKTAADGTGRNSPYTTRLLREIPIPGRPIELYSQRSAYASNKRHKGSRPPGKPPHSQGSSTLLHVLWQDRRKKGKKQNRGRTCMATRDPA